MKNTTHDAQTATWIDDHVQTPQQRAELAIAELEQRLEKLLAEVRSALLSSEVLLEACRESLSGLCSGSD